MSGKCTGTIAKIFPDNGYGFISPGHGKHHVFFHVSSLTERAAFSRLQLGQAVTYDVEDHERGPRVVKESMQAVLPVDATTVAAAPDC